MTAEEELMDRNDLMTHVRACVAAADKLQDEMLNAQSWFEQSTDDGQLSPRDQRFFDEIRTTGVVVDDFRTVLRDWQNQADRASLLRASLRDAGLREWLGTLTGNRKPGRRRSAGESRRRDRLLRHAAPHRVSALQIGS